MIGRLHHIVLDSADPRSESTFWSEVLGWPISYSDGDWTVVSVNETTSGLAVQLAPDHVPPRWPDPTSSQQVHLDIMVDDLPTASAQVLALGARRLSPPGADNDVFADPSGHPFCLVRRPGWAAPVNG